MVIEIPATSVSQCEVRVIAVLDPLVVHDAFPVADYCRRHSFKQSHSPEPGMAIKCCLSVYLKHARDHQGVIYAIIPMMPQYPEIRFVKKLIIRVRTKLCSGQDSLP